MAEAARRGRRRARPRGRRDRRLRGRGDGGRRRDRAQHADGDDRQHRQPLARCRSWTSARSSRCPCVVGRAGPVPVAAGERPRARAGADRTMKDVERTTIEAALTGSRRARDPALALHPLVPSRRPRARSSTATASGCPTLAGALRAMSVDLVVAATAFLDLTFIGLEALPGPGEERFAATCCARPAAARSTRSAPPGSACRSALAVAARRRPRGRFIREALAREGVASDRRAARAPPSTVVMPVDGERAMVTYEPGRARRRRLAGLRPARGRRRARPARPRARRRARLRDLRRRRRPAFAGAARRATSTARARCSSTPRGAPAHRRGRPREEPRERSPSGRRRGRDARGRRARSPSTAAALVRGRGVDVDASTRPAPATSCSPRTCGPTWRAPLEAACAGRVCTPLSVRVPTGAAAPPRGRGSWRRARGRRDAAGAVKERRT